MKMGHFKNLKSLVSAAKSRTDEWLNLSEDRLSPGAKLYISLVTVTGWTLLFYCFYHSLTKLDLRWLFLVALTFVASSLPVKIPLVKGKGQKVAISMGDAFIFTAILLFGPQVAVILAAVEGHTANQRAKIKRRYKYFFNVANLVLVSFIAGHLFYQLEGQTPPLDPAQVSDPAKLLIEVGIVSLFYFFLNTGLVALGMALATKQSFIQVWQQNFIWHWITHFAGASLGTIVFLCFKEIQFYFVAITVPTVLLIHYAYKMNLRSIEASQKHLDEVNDLLDREIEAERALQDAKNHLEATVQTRTQALRKEIREREVAEKALASEKEHLAVTVRSIGDGVITMDTQGRVSLINRVAEDLTGWTDREAVGRPVLDVFHIIDRNTRRKCDNPGQRVLETGEILRRTSKDILLVAKDGRERSISHSAAPICEEDGTIAGAILVFRDMTDHLRMEEELIRTDKLESLGVLAGGIAHDFNNVLAGILLKAQLARRALKKGKDPEKFLLSMEEATQRAAELNQQLLTFAKGGEPIKKTVAITPLLKESTIFALRGSRVACDFQISSDLRAIEADEGQLSQVINNLVINAEHAMPRGGTIIFRAENVQVNTIAPVDDLPPGPYVRISVQDDGVGIAPEHLPRLFDPYFTTKPKGNGLGLASVFSIVKRHGGHIGVESKVGRGSTFTLYLPAASKIPEEASPSGEELETRSGRILVMDDEEIVREGTGELLSDLGLSG